MAIDNPLDAIKKIHEFEDLTVSPLRRFARPLARIIEVLKHLDSSGKLDFVETALSALERRSQERIFEVVDALEEELKYVARKMEGLGGITKEQKAYLDEELPGLILDAFAKAEQTRSRSRRRRLAKIVAHAADQAPSIEPDYAEEMMRIAMNLDERDVNLLSYLRRYQGNVLTPSGSIDRIAVNGKWPLKPADFDDGELASVCAKLASFGLLAASENRQADMVDNTPSAYGVLRRGRDFLDFLQGASKDAE